MREYTKKPDLGTPLLALGVAGLSAFLAFKARLLFIEMAEAASIGDSLEGGTAFTANFNGLLIVLLVFSSVVLGGVLTLVCFLGPGGKDKFWSARLTRWLAILALLPGIWLLARIAIRWIS